MEVRCELVQIIISETRDSQTIVLKEADGPRAFPILIGFFEAAAIDRRLKGHVLPRPMTHDLLASVIEGLGGRLTRVVVTDLKHHTFYANLVIERNGEEIRIDSRPSDAIALAVANNTPIYVEEAVLEAASRPLGGPGGF